MTVQDLEDLSYLMRKLEEDCTRQVSILTSQKQETRKNKNSRQVNPIQWDRHLSIKIEIQFYKTLVQIIMMYKAESNQNDMKKKRRYKTKSLENE